MNKYGVLTYKYKIIEYDYVSMTNEKVEYCKTLHKTNSKLLFWLIILIFKIQGIKYDVVNTDIKKRKK